MQVGALVKLAQEKKLPPLQRRILNYLNEHPDEVFEYRDQELTQAVGGKPSSVGFSLWALHKRRLIERDEVAGKVYFGSGPAMQKLRAQLRSAKEDPFERANRNLALIRKRVGNIDVRGLLEEVREGK